MKIRKHSRILALALALVMVLPLISIPTFADSNGTLLNAQATPGARAADIYSLDFEDDAYVVGKAPSTAFSSIGVEGSVITDAYGSKSWKFDYKVNDTSSSTTGDEKNKDKNPIIKNPKISHSDYASVVFEASYFFAPGSTGQIEVQSNPLQYNNGADSKAWAHFFYLTVKNGELLLNTAGKSSKVSMKLGVWNTISVVIDMKNGGLTFYVNGNLAIEGASLGVKDIIFPENKVIVAKPNKIVGKGSIALDNIKLFAGNAPSVPPKETLPYENFEDFLYSTGIQAGGISMPSLATYERMDGGVALRLPIAGQAASDTSYALLCADCKHVHVGGIEWDGTSETVSIDSAAFGIETYRVMLDEDIGFYYATDPVWGDLLCADGSRHYFVPEMIAEFAKGGTNIGVATKIAHAAYAYGTNEKVVIGADYLLEYGSKGTVTAKLASFKYGSTQGKDLQLFSINAETGALSGTASKLRFGGWNNVKVILDLVTGAYDLYLNDVLVKSYSTGFANLTVEANSFVVATIEKTNRLDLMLSGAVCIDNVLVLPTLPEGYESGKTYLTDIAEWETFSNILNVLETPTVRFEKQSEGGPIGLRFITEINKERLQAFTSVAGNTIVDRGTLIAPYAHVLEAGSFTKESLDRLNKDINYYDVKYVRDFDKAASYGLDPNGSYMAASIVALPEDDFATDFAAIAYINVKIGNTTLTLYAANYTVANVRELSAKLIANGTWIEGQKPVLEQFAGDLTLSPDPGYSTNPIKLALGSTVGTVAGTVYYKVVAGQTVTVTGTAPFKYKYNNKTSSAATSHTIRIPTGARSAVFAIEGNGLYTFDVAYPLGSAKNPNTLVVETNMKPSIHKTYLADGYYYTWTAPANGTLTVQGADGTAPEAIKIAWVEGSQAKNIQGTTSLTLNAVAGREYTVWVKIGAKSNGNPKALTLHTTFAVRLAFENVITVNGRQRFEISDLGNRKELVVSGVPGFKVIYKGVEYSDDDGVCSVALAQNEQKAAFEIIGNNTQYKIEFLPPLGTVNRPVALYAKTEDMLIFRTSFAVNGATEYFYSWTNPHGIAGVVEFAFANNASNVDFTVKKANGTAVSFAAGSADGVLKVNVGANETLTVQVKNLNGAVAVNADISVSFQGAIYNPIRLTVNADTGAVGTVEAGKYYCVQGVANGELVFDLSGVTVTGGKNKAAVMVGNTSYYHGDNKKETRIPCADDSDILFTIADGNGTAHVKLDRVQLGMQGNPDTFYALDSLVLSNSGRYFAYTATADEKLSFNLINLPTNSYVKVSVVSASNVTLRYFDASGNSVEKSGTDVFGEARRQKPVEILLADGQEVVVLVQICSAQGGSAISGTLAYETASAVKGTFSYPAEIEATVNTEADSLTTSTAVTLAADNTTGYYLVWKNPYSVAGKTNVAVSGNPNAKVYLVKNGAETLLDGEFEAAAGEELLLKVMIAGAHSAQALTLDVAFAPVGSATNPETITTAINTEGVEMTDSLTVTLAENAKFGYYLTWRNPYSVAGSATFTVTGHANAKIYSVEADTKTPINGELALAANEELTLWVAVEADPATATLTLDVVFTPVLGSEYNPEEIASSVNTSGVDMTASADVTLPENDTAGYRFTWTNPYTVAGSALLSVTEGLGAKLYADGVLVEGALNVAAGQTVALWVVIDEAHAEAALTLTVVFTPVLGSEYNPDAISSSINTEGVDMTASADVTLPENDTAGYRFTWTNPYPVEGSALLSVTEGLGAKLYADGVLVEGALNVAAGQTVALWVVIDDAHAEAALTLTVVFTPVLGSEYNPIPTPPSPVLGSLENPEVIPTAIDTENVTMLSVADVTLAENDVAGYYFSWTNPYPVAGQIVLILAGNTEAKAYLVGDPNTLITDGITVAAGETVVLWIVIEAEHAETTLTLTVAFTPEAGSAYNPGTLV